MAKQSNTNATETNPSNGKATLGRHRRQGAKLSRVALRLAKAAKVVAGYGVDGSDDACTAIVQAVDALDKAVAIIADMPDVLPSSGSRRIGGSSTGVVKLAKGAKVSIRDRFRSEKAPAYAEILDEEDLEELEVVRTGRGIVMVKLNSDGREIVLPRGHIQLA